MTGIEIAAVAAAVGIAKNLRDLTSTFGDRVPQKVREQILALFDKVIDIQSEVVEARDREYKLIDRCNKLEGDLKRVQDWEAVKARYALTKIADRFFVYSLKPECAEGEPLHWLCEKCFVDRRPSILQGPPGGSWKCSNCGNTHQGPIRPGIGARVVGS